MGVDDSDDEEWVDGDGNAFGLIEIDVVEMIDIYILNGLLQFF